MPGKEKHPFFEGRVLMSAYARHPKGWAVTVDSKEFDHSTNQGRLAVRDFVHEHLCLGHKVTTVPL